MTTKIVICANDFPYAVLEVSDFELAKAYCGALQLDDPRNKEIRKKYNDAKWAPIQVFYHWHEVPEVGIEDAYAKARA